MISRFIRWLQGERRGLNAGQYVPTKNQAFIASLFPSIVIPLLVKILDVSFWQGVIDFAVMKAAGIKGVIIRAGQRTWIDVKFVVNWLMAKLAGIPRGSYWFYDSRETPQKQAALWYSVVKDDKGELFHVADFEESYGGPYGTPAHFKTFILEFQRLSRLPDDKIVIYTGFYWWGARVGNDVWFKRFKLWLAWYSPMGVVRVPLPWLETDLILWQDTDNEDGLKHGTESLNVDRNWFNGTPAEFDARFGIVTPPPPMNGEEVMTNLIVNAAYLNGRATPGGVLNFPAGSTLSTGFRRDDKLESPEYVVDSNGITKWYRISRCVRNGTDVALPATVWASDGGTAQYLLIETTVPPTETKAVSVTVTLEGWKPLTLSGEMEAE